MATLALRAGRAVRGRVMAAGGVHSSRDGKSSQRSCALRAKRLFQPILCVRGAQFTPGGRTIVASDLSHWYTMPQSFFFLSPGGRTEIAVPSAFTQNFYHTVFSTKH